MIDRLLARPYNALLYQRGRKEGDHHVLHISTTIEFEKKKRPWLQKAHEHQKWTKSFGKTSCERASSTGCVAVSPARARHSQDRLLFLKRSGDIEKVKKEGRRVSTPLFNLMFHSSMPVAAEPCRVGIVVGKRLGIAVVRNRAKRLFRELSRDVRNDLVRGYHLVVFPRRESLTVNFQHLRNTWRSVLQREGLLATEVGHSCDNSSSQ